MKLIRLSDKEYFSDKYKEYISNSRLSLINPDEGGSLEHYLTGYSENYSSSFELGSAVHASVLQPDDFEIAPVYKPTGKLGVFADAAYELLRANKVSNQVLTINEIIEMSSVKANYYVGKLSEKRLTTALEACEPYWAEREQYEEQLSEEMLEKQIYLSKSMFEKYCECINSIKRNKKISLTLMPEGMFHAVEYYNEYALFTDVKVTLDSGEELVLKLKSKLDNFTVDHDKETITLNDLKTTGKPAKFFMGNWVKDPESENQIWYNGSFQTYHYYRQMAMYVWLLNCYMQTQGIHYKSQVNMILVETTPNFETRICKVGGKYVDKGLKEFKKLLMEVAKWIEKQ